MTQYIKFVICFFIVSSYVSVKMKRLSNGRNYMFDKGLDTCKFYHVFFIVVE